MQSGRLVDVYEELISFFQTQPVFNTHCHHLPDEEFAGADLDQIIKNSYVNWHGIPLESCESSRHNFLEKVGHSNYFFWLEKGLQTVYGWEESLTEGNWDQWTGRIREAHQNPRYHLELLNRQCNYQSIILDTYWNPGSDNNHPEVFTPTFRVNSFFFGYSPKAADHDGGNAQTFYQENPADLDSYLDFTRRIILRKKEQGCLALKLPIAYDRGLDFQIVSRDKASKIFTHGDIATKEDIQNFQDFLLMKICQIAAELNLPLQCHTGMGQMRRTNALWLQEMIAHNPEVKFVLLHCSYPWIEDTSALHRLYPNVFPDLAWLPLLSISAAKRMLDDLIEGCPSDKVCWGCDTWTGEESVGALLALHHVLARALTRKIEEGYFTMKDARTVAENILYANARKLYGLVS